ncbi:MAG TPA: hypothetical protein VNZ47_11945 [Candidatus Dormibacteraeota bacterium]|jgi:hypothetical protein|nr:hypothetical protein [Candidatus Dormibacteraeota bacterium]
MKLKDAKRAALLSEAAETLSDVRLGLREKVSCGEMRLQVEAFELQSEDGGGVGHGCIYLPKDYAVDVLNFIETKLSAELSALGVTS